MAPEYPCQLDDTRMYRPESENPSKNRGNSPHTDLLRSPVTCFSPRRPYFQVMTTLSPSGRKVRLGKNMRATLEYAVRTPHRWHDIGKGRGAKMAIRRLAKAGLVEVRPVFNRFRLKH
jgi:hypothetical protein